MKTRYAKTMRDAIAEVWANDITLDEGRMKDIYTMQQAGKSAEEIAKKAIKVAADICVFTNDNVKIEKI